MDHNVTGGSGYHPRGGLRAGQMADEGCSLLAGLARPCSGSSKTHVGPLRREGLSPALGCPLKAEVKSTALDKKSFDSHANCSQGTPKSCPCKEMLEKQCKDGRVCKDYQAKSHSLARTVCGAATACPHTHKSTNAQKTTEILKTICLKRSF